MVEHSSGDVPTCSAISSSRLLSLMEFLKLFSKHNVRSILILFLSQKLFSSFLASASVCSAVTSCAVTIGASFICMNCRSPVSTMYLDSWPATNCFRIKTYHYLLYFKKKSSIPFELFHSNRKKKRTSACETRSLRVPIRIFRNLQSSFRVSATFS